MKNTILIVDDAPENIQILMAVLKDDYKILTALSGEKALVISGGAVTPDLILLDIMMPGIDGYEVIKRLKADEKTRDIPVIFVTVLSEAEDETKGLELGAVDYIAKPISPSIVKARVRNHLKLKQAQEELKKQNEILRENIRLREDVERITRHDIKSPLQCVINAPELLMPEGNLTANQIDILRIIEKSGYRIMEMVNSCLDLYKMETGRYEVKHVPVDLLKLVNQIRFENREMIKAKGLKIIIRAGGEPVEAEDTFIAAGEEMLCYSMLANLIKNAVEASPDEEQITITMEDRTNPVILIRNMGAVPGAVMDNFFDKYSSWGKKGGTGLGAYSARLIAETMGGNIHVDSSDGLSTTLTVSLPGYRKDPSTQKVLPLNTGRTDRLDQNLKIMVVDDHKAMRSLIIGNLRQMGFIDFIEADDGAAAMKILESVEVDLIISDWNTPELSGLGLLQHVRSSELLRCIPFILITGEVQPKNIIEAVKARVNEYIIKPFSSDILKEKIEKVLSKS